VHQAKQGRDAWIGVAGSHAHRIVLALRELTFMDTSGVHVIVDASHRLRESGGRLVLGRAPSASAGCSR
jgi:anti-anti-sigma factor